MTDVDGALPADPAPDAGASACTDDDPESLAGEDVDDPDPDAADPDQPPAEVP
jgi:hypothetical protein